MLVDIYVLEQGIGGVDPDLQQPWLSSLTFEVLHDLVVSGALLLMLSEDPIHSVDGRVRHELLEVTRLQQEVSDVHAENHIEG